jgi:excisionase family DNA binding protein
MLPKPRRPHEKRIAKLTRVTYTIAEFCEMTGIGRATLLRSIEDGSLLTVRFGTRRLILARSLATTRDGRGLSRDQRTTERNEIERQQNKSGPPLTLR